ncbi:MAG: HEAT repeat domain-containing protein [Candidatus Hydrothermales bacterium]
MEKVESLLIELLKQIGVGLTYSKMYPAGHPAFGKAAEQVLEIIKKFPLKYNTISVYFFENVILFEDTRIDISKIPAIHSMAKQFFRLKIESISIDRDVFQDELKTFFEIFTLPIKKFLEVENPSELLFQRNVERIRLNEVKFKLSSTEREIKVDLSTEESAQVSMRDIAAPKKEEIEIKLSEEDQNRIASFLRDYNNLQESEREEIIKNIFLKMIGLDIEKEIDIRKVRILISALKVISHYLLERYGEDSPSNFSLILTHILKILSPILRVRLINESEKYKDMADSIRKALSRMDDKELILLFSDLRKKEDEFPALLREIFEGRKIYEVTEKIHIDEEAELLEKLYREKKLVITEEKRLKFLERELESGIAASELESFLQPVMDKLNSGDENERISAIDALISFAITFLRANKTSLVEKVINSIKNKVFEEEHPAVIFSYIEGLEKIIMVAKEKNQLLIIEDIQNTFRDLLDSKSKKKVAIRALGKMGTQFSTRVLLTQLWDEESEKEIEEAFLTAGKEGFLALTEIFPEMENFAVKKRIVKILSLFPAEYRKEFYKSLENKYLKNPRDIVMILGEIKDEESIPFLIKMLKTGEESVKLDTLRSLSKFTTSSFEDDILEVYSEAQGKDIKFECLRTLLKIGTAKSVELIYSFIKDSLDKEELRDFIIPSINFLIKNSPEKALQVAEKVLFDKTFFKKPKFPSEIRVEVVRILSRYKSDKTLDILKRLLNDSDSQVKLAASMILRRF